jgi:hypothetical protein
MAMLERHRVIIVFFFYFPSGRTALTIIFLSFLPYRQCRTTLDCVPAQVCNKKTFRCERNITLYTLDSADWSEDYSSSVTLRTGDAVNTAGFMTLEVGTSGSGDGSDLTLQAGPTEDTAANGGDVIIKAGDVAASAITRVLLPTGTGGNIGMLSGASPSGTSGDIGIMSAASASTGNVMLATGDATGGSSGAIMLQSGDATGGSGGDVSIAVGSGTDVTGGKVSISAGDTTDSKGTGGAVEVLAGTGGASGTGGSILLNGGSGFTGGDVVINGGDGTDTDGDVVIGASNTDSISIGGSGVDVSIAGTVTLTAGSTLQFPGVSSAAKINGIYIATNEIPSSSPDEERVIFVTFGVSGINFASCSASAPFEVTGYGFRPNGQAGVRVVNRGVNSRSGTATCLGYVLTVPV